MKLKNGMYNIISNVLSQLITLSLGIMIPRLFLMNLGSELNGLVSSIGQVFMYISLLEAGIGLSATQALYKPVVYNNNDEINAILSAADKYYKKMGRYYIISIIIFALVYPLIIKTSVDNFTVIVIIILTGMGGAINFFLQNKYTILLNADGKNYIMTNINMVLNIMISLSKIILLMNGFSIIAIQLSQFIITLFRIGILNRYMHKNYKWINFNVKPDYSCLLEKNSVLIHQISYMIFNNTDILVLTIFCDLKIVSVYAIYNMLIGIVDGVISSVNNGTTFILGQLYAQDKDKFVKFFDIYELLYMVLVFSSFIIVHKFTMPFLQLYTSGINDINYIDSTLLSLFICLKLLAAMRTQCFTTINIAGHFKKTQNSSIIEAIFNLILSIILVNTYGIYGVVLGSIIAMIYRALYCVIYTNKNILNRSPIITFKKWIANIAIYFIGINILNNLNLRLTSYIEIVIMAAICYTATLIVVFLVNMILNKSLFLEVINFIRRTLISKKVLKNLSDN